ncbi:MAG: B12-binding domain-containing radical SAM protein [Candidatus Moranbacteria bacterium]|nr:B12-binding domain-containing radical SAM protein [Candidatus Moranbacteria bacterium]
MSILQKQELFRVIDPRFGKNNVYRFPARRTISLGPVMIATMVNRYCPGIVSRVVSENNFHRKRGAPIGKDELPNHAALQRKRKADYIGISASITNAVPRAKEVIKTYLSLPEPLSPRYILVGGWHAGDLPEEFLELGRNVVVFHGEAEENVVAFFKAVRSGQPLSAVRGISYWDKGEIKRNGPRFPLIPRERMDLLPAPDFGLVDYAKIKIFPLQRTRGCSGKCRFCRVRTPPRSISPRRFLEQVEMVVGQGGRRIFFVDDHFEGDLRGARAVLKRLALLRERRIKLRITTQNRLSLGDDPETLRLMSEAGVETAAVGCESPIPKELRAMQKPIDHPEKMVEWVRAFSQQGINLHMMLIFCYPMPPFLGESPNGKSDELLSAKARSRLFWRFIKNARPATLQVLLYTPIPGTPDWKLLENGGRIRRDMGWEYYDGTHLVFKPDEGLNPLEVQREIEWLMRRFYAWRIIWMFGRFSLLIHLAKVGIATVSMPFVWASELPFVYRGGYGFKRWFRTAWEKPVRKFRNAINRFSAQWIILDWMKQFKLSKFKEYWS